eukprot:GFKZ01006213.1.p1 GENE.GFKZ01006213.1~~GFKZ01006213.1.p1  ORF type:complete len:519 (-),score=95.16 GFKZ01006213.1:313-1869(-)
MTAFSPHPIPCLSLTPSATHLAAAAGQHNLSLIPLPTASSSPFPLPPPQNLLPTPSLTSISFPAPTVLYTSDSRGSFKRFNVPSTPSPSLSPSYTVSAAHGGEELTAIAATSSSSAIATSGKDGIVRVWDAETRDSIARLAGHRYEVRDIAVAASSDSDQPVTLVASAGRDRSVRLWDVRATSSSAVHVFKGHTGWVHAVDMAGGAKPVVVSCGGDKTVRVWDLIMMKERLVMKGHEYRVWDVAVTADGTVAVSGSTDATVRVWDLDTGLGTVWAGHEDTVLAVDVAKRGGLMVSGCEDGGLYLWSIGGSESTAAVEGVLVDTEDEGQKATEEVPKALDAEPLKAEKEDKNNLMTRRSPVALSPVEEVVVSKAVDLESPKEKETPVDAETLKKAVAVSADELPKFDKSAAELVHALKRIQELEKALAESEKKTVMFEEQMKRLGADLKAKDVEIGTLKKQVEAADNLVSAANVRALLAANPRKVDTALDYEEPVNKIGAVSDQLTALAARLDAMIATN